jgi:hypothetical protein
MANEVSSLLDFVAKQDMIVSGNLTVLGTTNAANSASITFVTASTGKFEDLIITAHGAYNYITTTSGTYNVDTAIDQLDNRISLISGSSGVRSITTGSFAGGAASISLNTALFPTADLDYITLFTSVKYLDNKWKNDLISYELYTSGSTCKVDIYCDDTSVTQYKLVAINVK